MIDLKKDFPIFKNNPWLVFFDSGASSQKPAMVTEAIKEYLENDYANIHRWAYSLSERSEEMYYNSKKTVASHIGGNPNEIIYTFNATYGFNLIAQSLWASGMLKKGDKILLSLAEHHANLVPWLMLKDYGVEVDFVNTNKNFDIDMKDFDRKYTDDVKLVAFTYASNVVGSVFDLPAIGQKLREDTLFVVDGSQAVPHFQVDMKELNCDFFIFTGHKVMADTGIWVIRWKKELLKQMKPTFSGGGAVRVVTKDHFTPDIGVAKFEAGTPNLTGALSLMKAFEYIDSIWWYEVIEKQEKELSEYVLGKFMSLEDKIELIGKKTVQNRLGIFSFVVKEGITPILLWEFLAEKNIAIRSGWHCAHPLVESFGRTGVCRMSLYIYNTKEDIDYFFKCLEELADEYRE